MAVMRDGDAAGPETGKNKSMKRESLNGMIWEIENLLYQLERRLGGGVTNVAGPWVL